MRKAMILACAVLFLTLAFSGCPSPTGNGGTSPFVNPPPPIPGSPTLQINQPVYLLVIDTDFIPVWGDRLTKETHTLNHNGGSGTISDGYLNFTIGTPTDLESIDRLFRGATFQPEGVQAAALRLTSARGEPLNLCYASGALHGNDWSMEYVERVHIYVSEDVLVTSPIITESEAETYQPYNLYLKAGWNAVHRRMVISETPDTNDLTVTISTADPGFHLRWALEFFEFLR